MNEREIPVDGQSIPDLLRAKVSRGRLLSVVAGGIALAAIPGRASAAFDSGASASLTFPFFPPVQGSYTTETIQDILNNVITTRYIVADLVIGALQTGAYPAAVVTSFQIGLARFQYEIDFLASLGARPTTTTATASADVLKNPALLPKFQVALATIFMSTFMTAVREFAELGQPVLAKWMTQLAAREAESLSDARKSTSAPISVNAFETDLFLYTRDSLDALRGLGVIGGPGPTISYPGRDAILAAAGPWANRIIQRKPNDAGASITINSVNDVDSISSERA